MSAVLSTVANRPDPAGLPEGWYFVHQDHCWPHRVVNMEINLITCAACVPGVPNVIGFDSCISTSCSGEDWWKRYIQKLRSCWEMSATGTTCYCNFMVDLLWWLIDKGNRCNCYFNIVNEISFCLVWEFPVGSLNSHVLSVTWAWADKGAGCMFDRSPIFPPLLLILNNFVHLFNN